MLGIQLPHGRRHLLVEHVTVGDHDHRIENLFVVSVQSREAEGRPDDGVGLARTSRVLDQVALADAHLAHSCHDLLHCIPLVETWETQ